MTSAHPIFDDVVNGRYDLLADALVPVWPDEGVEDIWRMVS